MSNENPRETLDKEAGIAQTKQAIAEAVADGDYDKVATLAQKAKSMEAAKGEIVGEAQSEALEDNKAFDEAKAAERDAELAEQAKLQAEKDSEEAAVLLAKLQGGPAKTVEAATIKNPEPIDAIALNNRIVNMGSEKQKEEALANLSEQEISAVTKMIVESERSGQGWGILDLLRNFGNKPEIISQPEIVEAFKNKLATGRTHLYDVDRVIHLIKNLPEVSKEIFDDTAVRNGVQNSIGSFVSYQTEKDWPHVSDAVDRVVGGINMTDQELRNVAEEIKRSGDPDKFIQHFGVKRLYPEMK